MARRLSLLEKEVKEKNHVVKEAQLENDALKAKVSTARFQTPSGMQWHAGLLSRVGLTNCSLCTAPTPTQLKVAEEEIARRALQALSNDDTAIIQHLKNENARLRASSKTAWKQVSISFELSAARPQTHMAAVHVHAYMCVRRG